MITDSLAKDQKEILNEKIENIVNNIILKLSCNDLINDDLRELVDAGILDKKKKTAFKKVLTHKAKNEMLSDAEIGEQHDDYKIVKEYIEEEVEI